MPSAHNAVPMPEAVERLRVAKAKEAPFLAAHHAVAAGRLMHTFQRARLAQRVTMSYDPARIGRVSGGPVQGELADSAADARQRLAMLARRLPHDCWSVLFDVCGSDRGLQDIEAAHGWPRRGAKLVLRVALEQLSTLYGLDAVGAGKDSSAQRAWLEERPPMFGDQAS